MEGTAADGADGDDGGVEGRDPGGALFGLLPAFLGAFVLGAGDWDAGCAVALRAGPDDVFLPASLADVDGAEWAPRACALVSAVMLGVGGDFGFCRGGREVSSGRQAEGLPVARLADGRLLRVFARPRFCGFGGGFGAAWSASAGCAC